MLINLSNHPSANWSDIQLKAAEKYGQIVDLPFPVVNPGAETCLIRQLAEDYYKKVMKHLPADSSANFIVHIMGELTFCFALVALLQKSGIQCIVSTTSRQAINQPDGAKVSRFEFVKFREYSKI